jgi:sialate O-acetylesterase
MKLKKTIALTIVLLTILPTLLVADVKLPSIINSHMVLQQNSRVPIWGTADAGENISVRPSWSWFAKSTTADQNGKWKIILKTPRAGGPHKIIIAGKNKIVLKDVLTGEVWLASGQSNMEMPLGDRYRLRPYSGVKNYKEEIANANYPRIRFYHVPNRATLAVQDDISDARLGKYDINVPEVMAKWTPCEPNTAEVFSATAYFFGRELHQQLNVPIGLIGAEKGGSPIEKWMPDNGRATFYNAMIAPVAPFSIRGFIWYQGESNHKEGLIYYKKMRTMIEAWRRIWNNNDLPFYYALIAPFDYSDQKTATLWEAQLEALTIPNTGMVVTTDTVDDLKNIHPKNKLEVGYRFALLALANDYGKDIIYSGPIYKYQTIEANRIRIHFDHTAKGLKSKDDKPLCCFQIASNNKKFVDAAASIEGNTILVSSDNVQEPVAVRFAFRYNDLPNLVNSENLPATPFRTDYWETE